MTLPETIRTHIAERIGHTNRIGMSDSTVTVYDDCVLKIENITPYTDETINTMRWLESRIPSPGVLCYEKDHRQSYLLMSRIPGKMCCDATLLDDIGTVLQGLADGLSLLWRTDPTGCPRNRTLPNLLKEARYRVENGLVDLQNVEPDTFGPDGFESPEHLLQWLEEHPVPSVPVLAHGDYCLPNVFMENGQFSGFVDVGDAGLGEKWRDIALCWRSLRNNYDGSYGGKIYADFDPNWLFAYLHISPDWQQINYHLLLDELF
jgi:kanamycin kinase/aminoglycoside 3'-phosphotransferase-3